MAGQGPSSSGIERDTPMSKKNNWYKPNFWTLAYLDEASRDKGGSRPVGGCGGFLRAILDIIVFLGVSSSSFAT